MPATPSNSDAPRQRRRISLSWFQLLSCCLYFEASFLLPMADATVTVVRTGTRYNCRQDKAIGKQLWRGYEYMAALQFVPGNLPLCPPPPPPPPSTLGTSQLASSEMISGSTNNHFELSSVLERKSPAPYVNITVPEDGMPVALLVQSGAGCALKDKIEFALTRIQPAGVVRYLLVDDTNTDVVEDAPDPHSILNLDESLRGPSALPLPLRPSRVESITIGDGNGNDIPLYILYIPPRAQFELLDYLLKLDPAEVRAGGPRISLDSRTTDGWWDGEGAVWIALSALLSACACSFLLIVGGNAHGWWQPEEDHHPPPVRPQRRRLTREQVKRLLPHWRYDGTELQPIAGEGMMALRMLGSGGSSNSRADPEETVGLVAAAASAADAGPELSGALIPPRPVELSLCSICLDDYEPGDKLRVLSCNHAFHGKCIGKWLVERSATCPLCKTEIWDGEPEDEEGGEGATTEVLPPLSSPPPPREYGANGWDRAWHRFFTNDAYPYLQQQQQQGPEQVPTPAALVSQADGTYRAPTLPMGSDEAEIPTNTTPSTPLFSVGRPVPSSSSSTTFWRRLRRRLSRHLHAIPSHSSSSEIGGVGIGASSSTLAEPLLEHSDRDLGSELRILSPRRTPSPTNPLTDEESTRIQGLGSNAASSDLGAHVGRQRRRRGDDPLAMRDGMEVAEPSIPPSDASSSPPRQVSV